MASITGWTRLEPRVRSGDPTAALEARVHDPLWLLARQWQVGEFMAEDAGSPLLARIRLERSPLTRYRAGALPDGPAEGEPYDPARFPLEALVEREAPTPDLVLAFQAGLHFRRLLERNGVARYGAAYVGEHPLEADDAGAPVDPETRRLLRMARGRVPDGVGIASALRSASGALPTRPLVEPGDEAAVLAAGEELVAWLEGRTVEAEDGASWIPERMEYAFAVAAPTQEGETVLVADEYAGGHLDWHAFDVRPGATLGGAADQGKREVLVHASIPAPVTYRGMPLARWWEFEDGGVNLGGIDAEPSDLLRLVLLGFALDYGNDWFLSPVELPAGALYRVTNLVVTDGFGVDTLVRPHTQVHSGEARWRMFALTGDDGGEAEDAPLLLLPPSLPASLHGEPIEEVLLVRDEVANLAWAIERRVGSAGGRPFDRFETSRNGGGPSEPGLPDEPLTPEGDSAAPPVHYRLSTSVPPHWIPLVPTRVDPDRPDVRLTRGRVLLEERGVPTAPLPLGRLLEPGRPLHLFEEEVGRAGARLTRAFQYARWADGSGHLWIGRRKGTGRGEGASGLRFDALEEG